MSRAGIALVLLLGTSCSASGCDGFDPRSTTLPRGGSTSVRVQVADGRVSSPVDVNGGYDEVTAPVGSAAGERAATVRRRGDGLVMVLDGQEVALDGPLGCD